MSTEIETFSPDFGGVQVMPMEAQARAEIDIQIATAKRYPRSIKRFLAESETLATLNPEIARSCTYAKPLGGGKFAIGPSIRLAEIMLSTWGNLNIGQRLIEETPTHITTQGVVIDYQSNVRVSIEVRRSVLDKNGRTYSDSVMQNTINAAASIAIRNALFRVIPKSLVEKVRLAAAEVANGGASIEQLREEWLALFGSKGVDERRLCSGIGVAGKDDLGMEQLELLRAIATAIKDQETTVEEAFPPLALIPAKAEASGNGSGPDPVTSAWERHKQSRTDQLAEKLKGSNGKSAGAPEPPAAD